MIPELLKLAHEPPTSAHLGCFKTLDKLQRLCYWSGMAKDIQTYISNCETCKTVKPINYSTRPKMGKFHEVFRPFQQLYLDFLGPYPRSKNGNCYLLIVLDKLTRFIWLHPLRNATAQATVKYLENVFLRFSVPEVILTDNGQQFISNLFNDLCKKYGIQHILTPKYSPQCNTSERVNRTLLSSIRAYIKSNQSTWDAHISEFESAINNSKHQSTEFSPHFSVFGQHQILHGSEYKLLKLLNLDRDGFPSIAEKSHKLSLTWNQALEHLRTAHNNSAHRYNLRSTNRIFNIGDRVYIRNFTQSDAIKKFNAKLAPKRILGYIHKPVGSVAYEIIDENAKVLGVYHIKDLMT